MLNKTIDMDFTFKFGEMTHYERELLYGYVLRYDPDIILECGSGVGASTKVMVEALRSYAQIYSCDPKRRPKFTSNKLKFYPVKSDVLIDMLLEAGLYPDFIFFDGPEDPEVALNDFIKLDKHADIGTVFSMHDWCTEIRLYDGNVSVKALLIKHYINSLSTWALLEETDGLAYEQGKESVGLCLYEKISL